MNIIDVNSKTGKLRLRCGDFGDLPLLPDEVYLSALEDCNDNLPRAAALCANYILGLLSSKTHRKLAQLETWGNEHFENYVKFLKMTVLNPNSQFSVAPVPYVVGDGTEHPLIAFVEDWNTNFGDNLPNLRF